MTIYELRDLLEHSDIADLPLRCSTYSRVSTEKETQAASLHNMTDDFRDYIERHKNWTFVKAFIDDGKSGLTTKKRKDFLNLLAAGAAGEYDLLVTGEISRFGRNTMEGLQNIQYLKDKGIPVIFLYDDLNTYDTDCDIQIQQKLVDAENESRKISKRVKRGHQKSIQKGHVLGCRMWGYKKVNCKLEIDEKTAPMVRRIFELYATNQYSMKEIEEIIFQEGYRNNNGNRLSHTTMSNIITNPKYKGYFVGGKVKVIDIFNKRQKFLPEDEWLMYKDEDGTTVPALVSEELWQAANEVFKRRSIDVKGRRNCSTHKNIYTGKLYCTEDGAPYYCKDVHYKGTNVSKWLCSHKINHGTASCRSIAIYESELNPIILDAFREFSKGADEILATYLEQYRQVMDDTAHYKTERERIAKELSSIDEKQDQLLDMKVSGDLTLDEFKRMMDKTRAQKAELEKALDSMANWEEIAEQMEAQVERLKRALSFKLEDLEDGMINRDFVDNFIKRIDVTPNSDRQISLKIHLLTGEIVQKELEKIKGRTGQLSNIVFPGHPLKELAEIARAHIRVLRRLIQADPPPDIPVNVIQNLLLAVYLVQPALLYGTKDRVQHPDNKLIGCIFPLLLVKADPKVLQTSRQLPLGGPAERDSGFRHSLRKADRTRADNTLIISTLIEQIKVFSCGIGALFILESLQVLRQAPQVNLLLVGGASAAALLTHQGAHRGQQPRGPVRLEQIVPDAEAPDIPCDFLLRPHRCNQDRSVRGRLSRRGDHIAVGHVKPFNIRNEEIHRSALKLLDGLLRPGCEGDFRLSPQPGAQNIPCNALLQLVFNQNQNLLHAAAPSRLQHS